MLLQATVAIPIVTNCYFFPIIFQYCYPKAVFSYISALYLQQFTDEIPQYFDVTIPRDYPKLNEQYSAKNTGLTFNSVIIYYFLEVILKKLSQSSYSNHYIFKGGFLLSNVIGVESRSTVDIDFLFHQITPSEETVKQQLKEILAVLGEGISLTIQSITAIKESNDYGGYRATILCQLENIKQVIHLNIATEGIL